ncbi:hypothetical protein X907_0214 [Glycocaulis alkaliphilus]|uniref:Uncharacterized protein n=1 Tax=Glycocaulis alkaliphilus TaxID=1434191 RepID=A0A3T0E609_9PROT|nr:hypothetical protein [Glycocaulis alkaliphilus]AZU02763.1 hypothetical protein X907_0214 [Glycocaulis alkaliphilus]GGB85520.1 hypothetical protein GCM10007417_26950 [Glycocaulis alkaliphilus]
MSFYMRTANGKTPRRSRNAMRLATSLTLFGYPLGGLVMLNAPLAGDGSPGFVVSMAGLGVIAMAVFAFFYIAPSYMQRIIGEQVCELDDLERDLRQKAYAFAYHVLTGLVAAFIFYLAVANDDTRLTLWAPSTYSHWNTIFWGVLLYCFTLPTAYLAWTMPDIAHEFADEELDSEPARKPGIRWWLWGLIIAGGLAGFILARVIT